MSMSSEDFKTARLALGLSVAQLARILNTDPATVRKWEMPGDRSTARAPNPIAARVMVWLRDGWRPPEWPARPYHRARDETLALPPDHAETDS